MCDVSQITRTHVTHNNESRHTCLKQAMSHITQASLCAQPPKSLVTMPRTGGGWGGGGKDAPAAADELMVEVEKAASFVDIQVGGWKNGRVCIAVYR